MKTLLTIILLIVFSLPVSAEVTQITGDLRTVVADITRLMREVGGRESGSFRVPTLNQMSTWRSAIRSVLSGHLSTADQRLSTLASSYKVVQFIDVNAGRPYVLLVEATVTDRVVPRIVKGWGTYVFDLDAQRELSIQVPHPLADAGTELEGIEVFLQLGARSFLMAGTHRCSRGDFSRCDGTTTACSFPDRMPFRKSDVAHTPSNMFHQTHKQVMRSIGETVAIQLHGNIQSGCPDILISNTNANFSAQPDGNVRRLGNNFDIGGVGICDHRPGSCNLCGTDNVQGRFSNGSASPCDTRASSTDEQFIHIEQSQAFRDDFAPLIEALQRTFP